MTSPVQPGRDRPWLILAGAAVAALLVWSLQQDPIWLSEPAAKEQAEVATQRASANLPALFTSDDYPQAALRRNEQGTVAFKLFIDRRGRVERCEIEKGSGSAALDQTTCRILQRRARFTPARGPGGEGVADVTTGRIRWELPD
jgi:protein TonB